MPRPVHVHAQGEALVHAEVVHGGEVEHAPHVGAPRRGAEAEVGRRQVALDEPNGALRVRGEGVGHRAGAGRVGGLHEAHDRPAGSLHEPPDEVAAEKARKAGDEVHRGAGDQAPGTWPSSAVRRASVRK